jgi:hypothetical protein
MKYLFPTLSLLALLVLPCVGRAQVTPAPSLLNFQGRLTKPDGTPVADGSYSVRFSLWSAASAGTERWNQTLNPITVRNGTFAALLNVASPANLFDTSLWLEIKVGTNAPLMPRQQLVSVGYAMKANTVPDNSITNKKIVSVDWSKILNVPSLTLDLPYSDTVSSTDPAFRITNQAGPAIMGETTNPNYAGGTFINNAGGNALVGQALGSQGIGVVGLAANPNKYGGFFANSAGNALAGEVTGPFGNGVLGYAANANYFGGYFSNTVGNALVGTAGPQGTGVIGETSSPTKYGGHFKNNAGGIALRVDGTTSTGVLEIQGGADIAERFTVRGKVQPGMVVEIDPKQEGVLRLARGAYNPRIAGIVSGAKNLAAGVILTDPKTKIKNTLPIAMNGRVWVWCDATKRAIEPGNFLTSSSRPGYAMAALRSSRAQGAILGKAMTRLPKGKTGLVLALVNLQ